jgi:hypothetical protein
MGSKKIAAPKPRDYKQEMLDSMAGQEAIQPRLLELERQYQPLYQKLQQEMMDRQMGYQMDSYEKALPRSQQIAGMAQQGAMSAYRQGMGADTMGLYDTMLASAQTDLSAGRGLTPEMEKYAQQSARQAMAARGLSGNQAVAQEVLNNYQLGEGRENRSRQFAGMMYGAGQGNLQNALGTYSPYAPQTMYGGAASMTQGLGAQIFNPESQYNAGLITANRKEEMDVKIANQQASNSRMNAIIGGVGSIAGAAMGNPALFAGSLGGGGGMNLGANSNIYSSLPSYGSSITGASPYSMGSANLGMSMSGSSFGSGGLTMGGFNTRGY